jgi:hypothetical protein
MRKVFDFNSQIIQPISVHFEFRMIVALLSFLNIDILSCLLFSQPTCCLLLLFQKLRDWFFISSSQKFHFSYNLTNHGVVQGWPTFLASGPNFRYVSTGGPKISSKKIWRAKKGIFCKIYVGNSL